MASELLPYKITIKISTRIIGQVFTQSFTYSIISQICNTLHVYITGQHRVRESCSGNEDRIINSAQPWLYRRRLQYLQWKERHSFLF